MEGLFILQQKGQILHKVQYLPKKPNVSNGQALFAFPPLIAAASFSTIT